MESESFGDYLNSLLVKRFWFPFFLGTGFVVCYFLNYGTFIAKDLPCSILDLNEFNELEIMNQEQRGTSDLQVLPCGDIFNYLPLPFGMKYPPI